MKANNQQKLTTKSEISLIKSKKVRRITFKLESKSLHPETLNSTTELFLNRPDRRHQKPQNPPNPNRTKI